MQAVKLVVGTVTKNKRDLKEFGLVQYLESIIL